MFRRLPFWRRERKAAPPPEETPSGVPEEPLAEPAVELTAPTAAEMAAVEALAAPPAAAEPTETEQDIPVRIVFVGPNARMVSAVFPPDTTIGQAMLILKLDGDAYLGNRGAPLDKSLPVGSIAYDTIHLR